MLSSKSFCSDNESPLKLRNSELAPTKQTNFYNDVYGYEINRNNEQDKENYENSVDQSVIVTDYSHIPAIRELGSPSTYIDLSNMKFSKNRQQEENIAAEKMMNEKLSCGLNDASTVLINSTEAMTAAGSTSSKNEETLFLLKQITEEDSKDLPIYFH